VGDNQVRRSRRNHLVAAEGRAKHFARMLFSLTQRRKGAKEGFAPLRETAAKD